MADVIKKDESMGWPTPDAIIKPQPTADQDLLWEKIYQAVSAEDLEKEVKFVRLPLAFRNYLAKNSVANRIGEIGQKFNLVPLQVQKLAKIVRRYFIKEIALVSLDNIIGEELKISLEITAAIRESLTDILKAVPSVSVPTPPPPPTPPSAPVTPLPVPPPPLIAKALVAPITPPPAPPARVTPTLLQTKEAAHPEEKRVAPAPPVGDEPFDAAQDKPFIIYKERPEMRETPRPPAPAAPARQSPPPPIRPPGVRIPIKTPATTQTVPRPAPPISSPQQPTPPSPAAPARQSPPSPAAPARQSPPSPKATEGKAGEARMVHYSNLRTPL